MIGTTIVERESLFFGLAKVYIGDSASNITETGLVLSSNYFGCIAEISFTMNKKYLKKYSSLNGMELLVNAITIGASFEVQIGVIELTGENLSHVTGGDGTYTNILNNIFADPEDLRAEIIFTYPNGTNQMQIILPIVKVLTTNIDFVFSSEKPMQTPMQLSVLKCDDSAWESDPMGKIIFI